MSKSVSFKSNTKGYEAQLKQAKKELAELEAELKDYDVQTDRCRESIQMWRDFIDGKSTTRTSGKISALNVNPETNRPSRGKRRGQIELICKKLGRGKNIFRTIDVLNQLNAVESELSSGMKSYTYAVMKTLDEEGFVTKVGRGKWQLLK